MTSATNFEIDRNANFQFTGYKERLEKLCSRVEVGDKLLYYITKTHTFGAICTVTSPFYIDRTPHWSETDEVWPCRLNLRPEVVVPEDKMLDVIPLLPSLSFVTQKQKASGKWGTAFMGSLRRISQQDFELVEREMKKLMEKEATVILPSYHDQIKEMLYEIGHMEGRVSEKECHLDGERIDVVWRKIKGGNPYAVFEVQIGGNFYEALAKLKHAWDKWNSHPYLVTTDQYKEKALAWISGSFHEMEQELKLVDCEKVKELYEAIKKAGDIKAELGIR